MSQTLFDQLRGREGISKIFDDTVEIYINNPKVSPRFFPLKERREYFKIINTN